MLRFSKNWWLSSLPVFGVLMAATVVFALPPNQLPVYYVYDLDGNTALARNHVFVRSGDTWVEQAVLEPQSGTTIYGSFGAAVALQGDIAAITSYGQDDHQPPDPDNPPIPDGPGSLFIFKRNGTTWTQQQELVFTPNFGSSIDLDGNNIVVSEEGEHDDGWQNRVDFVEYNGTNWHKTAEFKTISGQGNSRVALSGNRALAVSEDHTSPTFKIVVQVYEHSNGVWTEQAALPYEGDYTLRDIDLAGNTAVIGNKVYVYNGTSWSLQATLVPNEDVDFPGIGVAIEGNTIVLASRNKSFVFTRNNGVWTQSRKLTVNGQDIGVSGYLGSEVEISGNLVQIKQYTFDLNEQPPAQNLLVNGDFEIDLNQDFVPDGWTRKNADGGGQRCNKVQQPPVAYSGQCAYLFKGGSGGTTKLTQNVNFSQLNLQAGDQIKLTGFYSKQSAGVVSVYLYVSYNNLPEDQKRINLQQTTSGYQPVNPSTIRLKATPTRIRVVLENATTLGKTWFDGLSLYKINNPGLLPLVDTDPSLLPLPQAGN